MKAPPDPDTVTARRPSRARRGVARAAAHADDAPPVGKGPSASPVDDGRPETLRAFSRSLPMALLTAREAVMSRFRPMLRRHGLTEQQWRVLRALTAADGPLRVREIARATYVSLPSLSRLLKTLEARGVVRRTVHADDLRAAQVSLSGAGRALVARIAPESEAGYGEITAAIGQADLERLYGLLDAVRRQLVAADAAADRGPDDEADDEADDA